jgi:hypothetical protein
VTQKRPYPFPAPGRSFEDSVLLDNTSRWRVSGTKLLDNGVAGTYTLAEFSSSDDAEMFRLVLTRFREGCA